MQGARGQTYHHQTVIKTTFRMTYSDVNDIIAGRWGKAGQFKAIVPSIDSMVQLHEILESMRFKRGAQFAQRQ